MRTTKVKRLWPVLALAPLFALAAILGVSLWHNGPSAGWLTPPAAEAQDRAITPMADNNPTGGTCAVNLVTASDVQCITSGDTIDVVLHSSGSGDSGADQSNVGVYVTGVSGSVPGATVSPGIQASAGSEPLGKKGVGLFRYADDISYSQVLAGQKFSPGNYDADTYQMISVRRSWANEDGDVWMFIHIDLSNAEAALKIPADAADGANIAEGGNTVDRIVQVHFTQDLNQDNTSIISGLPGPATRSPKAAEGMDRSFPVSGNEVVLSVSPTSGGTGSTPGIGGQIEVVTNFAAGSALARGAENPLMDTDPETEGRAPSYIATTLRSTIEGWETEGDDADGPFRASVAITHIANDDTRTPFDPIVLYRLGPPAEFLIVDTPDDPHRILDADDNYGKIQVQLQDAIGQPLTSTAPGRLIIEGADERAMAILDYDDEAARTMTYDHNVRVAGATSDNAFEFDIAIKDEAASGMYNVNLVVREGTGDNAETLATAVIPIEVIGAPTMMDGALAETTVNPTQSLDLRNVRFSADGQSAYALNCHLTADTAPPTRTSTNSICDWSGKTPADRAVLEGAGMGSVNTDGTATIMVKADAPPGTYTLVISDGRTGGTGVADKELQFTVRSRPTQYTLTGPDRIEAGNLGSYTVTALDANRELPYLPTEVKKVGVVVLGGGAYVSTLLVEADGTVMLNDQGEATFTVVAALNTPPGTSVNIAISGVGADPVSRTVAIGPMLDPKVPSGLAATSTASADGRTAAVTLTWTAGAGATRHWIAGIKQSELDARNYANVIWTPADSAAMHMVPNLAAGEEYVFTVAAFDGTTWSDWAPLFRYTPTGSGLNRPF